MARCKRCNKFMIFASKSGFCHACNLLIEKELHAKEAKISENKQLRLDEETQRLEGKKQYLVEEQPTIAGEFQRAEEEQLRSTAENSENSSGIDLTDSYPIRYKVGDIIYLGHYGGKSIEWQVLSAEKDKLLMISAKGLENICFNPNRCDSNIWINSYVREWLNDKFYNESFNTEEKSKIIVGPTGDNVWLLSVDESKYYFKDNDARICIFENEKRVCWWWLRSPGSYSDRVAYVGNNGHVYALGRCSDNIHGSVRAVVVMRLDISRYDDVESKDCQSKEEQRRLLEVRRRIVEEAKKAKEQRRCKAEDTKRTQEEQKLKTEEAKRLEKYGVGKVITMGKYNSNASIEWLILDAQGDRLTMIALKGQELKCFDHSGSNRWENSSLRSWLNSDFYNTAFSAIEKAQIVPNVNGDHVWLLSTDEADRYFANNEARICLPSAHIKYPRDSGGYGWWLRTAGNWAYGVACVLSNGRIDYEGSDTDARCTSYDYEFDETYKIITYGMVRPVITISISEAIKNTKLKTNSGIAQPLPNRSVEPIRTYSSDYEDINSIARSEGFYIDDDDNWLPIRHDDY